MRELIKTIRKAVGSVGSFINVVYNKLHFIYYKVMIGKSLKVNGRIKISGTKGKIVIGNNVVINSSEYAIPIGYTCKTIFWILGDGKIIIGDNTGMSNVALCSQSSISIGNGVLLGGGVKIYDTDFHSINYIERRNINTDKGRKSKPIIIEDDAFIGAGSMILKGSIIGARSIIGANSVVSGTVPADEIWAGNPAKFIRKIE